MAITENKADFLSLLFCHAGNAFRDKDDKSVKRLDDFMKGATDKMKEHASRSLSPKVGKLIDMCVGKGNITSDVKAELLNALVGIVYNTIKFAADDSGMVASLKKYALARREAILSLGMLGAAAVVAGADVALTVGAPILAVGLGVVTAANMMNNDDEKRERYAQRVAQSGRGLVCASKHPCLSATSSLNLPFSCDACDKYTYRTEETRWCSKCNYNVCKKCTIRALEAIGDTYPTIVVAEAHVVGILEEEARKAEQVNAKKQAEARIQRSTQEQPSALELLLSCACLRSESY